MGGSSRLGRSRIQTYMGTPPASYAKQKKLTDLPRWKWAKRVKSIDSSRLIRLARQIV